MSSRITSRWRITRMPWVLALCWGFAGSLPLAAARAPTDCTFHVAPTGSDDNAGGADTPWQTLQHAADVAGPGDTVCIHGGTYHDGEVLFTHSGTEQAPILFTAVPGEIPLVKDSLTLRQGVSDIQLAGLSLSGFAIWGISLEGDNSRILLSHLDLSGGDAGIHCTIGDSGAAPEYGPVTDLVIEDSTFRDATYTAVDCTPGPCNGLVLRRLEISGSGLSAGFGGDGVGIERGEGILVEDCTVRDNGGDGIDLNSRDWDHPMSGIVVRRNQVVRNHSNGIKLWAGGRMENNVVWGGGLCPVVIGAFPCSCEMVNNTIGYCMYDSAYGARDYALSVAYPDQGDSPAVQLTMVNNVFAFNTGPDVGSPTGIYLGAGVQLTEHHNLYWSREDGEIQADFVTGRDVSFSRAEIADGTWTAFTGQGLGDVTEDPLFLAAWPDVDLHLQAGSPCIDAGSAAEAPAEDADGRSRDPNPDIGAYEAGATAGISVLVQIPATTVHPGDEFWMKGVVTNPGTALTQAPLFFLLDVFGAFYFWPSWSLYDPADPSSIDFGYRDLPQGQVEVMAISPFTWPDTGDESVDGLVFYGAVLNQEMTEILGDYGSQTWGYGP